MKIAVFHELHEGGARRAVNELSVRLKNKHIVDLYYVSPKKNKIESKYSLIGIRDYIFRRFDQRRYW